MSVVLSAMSSLSSKQQKFAFLVGKLILQAYEMGYGVSFGECYRTPEQAALNAAKGIGIKNSLHGIRLAVDINLFKDGKYLARSEDYKILGEWWEAQDPECAWGGRFNDGNHFSLKHGGRA